MSEEPSIQQSEENYDYFHGRYKEEHENPFVRVTHVSVLDEFLKKELVSRDFHKHMLKECIYLDKKEEHWDLCVSMMISSFIMSLFSVFIVPLDQYYLFKLSYYLYLFTVYFITVLFCLKYPSD